MKKERIRKPFRYSGYKIDIINSCISLYIIVMFVAVVVGLSWRIKYMFLVTGAGVIFNCVMGRKFCKQKRLICAGLVWIYAGILFILCMCDIFRIIF